MAAGGAAFERFDEQYEDVVPSANDGETKERTHARNGTAVSTSSATFSLLLFSLKGSSRQKKSCIATPSTRSIVRFIFS